MWSGCGGGLGAASSDAKSERHDGYALKRHPSRPATPPSSPPSSASRRQHQPDLHLVVNGVAHGNATVGTIDQTGKYRAPASLPTPPFGHHQSGQQIRIRPISATSSVSLQNPIPVAADLEPHLPSRGQFHAERGRRELCKRIQSDVWWNRAGDHLCESHPAHRHGNGHCGAGRNGQDHGRES